MANPISDLSRIKQYLSVALPCDDLTIKNILLAAEAFIEKETGTSLSIQDFDIVQNGSRSHSIWLKPLPLVSIDRISWFPTSVIRVTTTGKDRATVSCTADGLELREAIAGVATLTTILFATYTTFQAVANQISTIAGWTGTVINPALATRSSTDLKHSPGINVRDNPSHIKSYLYDLADYDANYKTGEVYSLWAFQRNFQNYRIEYRAGFAEIPDDLTQVIAELTANSFFNKSVNTAMKSETVGAGSWTRADIQVGYDSLSALARHTLMRYTDMDFFAFKNF